MLAFRARGRFRASGEDEGATMALAQHWGIVSGSDRYISPDRGLLSDFIMRCHAKPVTRTVAIFAAGDEAAEKGVKKLRAEANCQLTSCQWPVASCRRSPRSWAPCLFQS